MGSTTDNFEFYLPDLGEVGTSWYDDVNANFTKLDGMLDTILTKDNEVLIKDGNVLFKPA
jgi:hypothetical protein